MGTEIVKCKCGINHKFQDETYGKDNRVGNSTMKANEFSCTVCNKVVDKSGKVIKSNITK